MEKVIFQSPQNGEALEFYVVEQTTIAGINYLLVTEEEQGDCDAFILKEVSEDHQTEATYEVIESEEELESISRVFGELLEEVDLTM